MGSQDESRGRLRSLDEILDRDLDRGFKRLDLVRDAFAEAAEDPKKSTLGGGLVSADLRG